MGQQEFIRILGGSKREKFWKNTHRQEVSVVLLHGLFPGEIIVHAEVNVLRHVSQLTNRLIGKGSAHSGDGLGETILMHHDHIHISFNEDGAIIIPDRSFGLIKSE